MKSHARELSWLFLLTPLASAADTMTEANGITGSIAANINQSDNLNKQHVNSGKEGDTQQRYFLDLGANYANDWSRFNAHYDAREEIYVDSYTIIEGGARLALGNDYNPFALLLTDSRNSVLATPTAVDLPANRDERNIFGAQPSVKLHFSSADQVVFKGVFDEVTYRLDDTKKTSRAGGEIDWVRGITKADEVQLTVQQLKTSFSSHHEIDYTYKNVSALYSVHLNHFDYAIGVGGNSAEIEAGGKSYSRPSYNFTSNYTTGNHVFRLNASQIITDSSRGNGNSESLGDTSNIAKDQGMDLINLRSIELSWTTAAICERCTLNINAVQHAKYYRQLTEENTHEKGFGGSFKYRLTRAASINVRANHLEKTFEPGGKYSGYTSNLVNVSYQYTFINDVNLNIYGEHEGRSSAQLIQNYDVNTLGLRLSYSF